MQDNLEILEDLRALAADGPQAAPDRVGRQLLGEFRARRRRQRARLWTSMSGAAAIAAGIVLLLWVRELPKPAAPVPAEIEAEAEASFYPLPQAEALPEVENAMVVRVQLPVSSLRSMGFPMDEERTDEVQAELLLGQDGLARGVRLVQ